MVGVRPAVDTRPCFCCFGCGRWLGRKLACVSSDGAKACIGGNLGVRGRIQRQICSKIVFFWCGGHRVNLCLNDACEEAGAAFAELESLLKVVYLYVSGSPKRRTALKEICDELDKTMLMPVNFVSTRWISRWVRAGSGCCPFRT
jgi:hypothetical protein